MRRNIEYKNIEDFIYYRKIKKSPILLYSIFYILYYRKAKRKKINELEGNRAHFCSENST